MSDLLVWLDLETTGLHPVEDVILECAILVTDTTLEVVRPLVSRVFPWNKKHMDFINTYVQEMHTKNGLWDECHKMYIEDLNSCLLELDDFIISILKPLKEQGHKLFLAGNSIHFDRSFLNEQMETFNDLFEYRQLDVSSIKLMCKWLHLPEAPKTNDHRAAEDVLESLEEYRFLLQQLWGLGHE